MCTKIYVLGGKLWQHGQHQAVRNTELISWIWVTSHRWMQGIPISNIRRPRRHCGSTAILTPHGWKQSWLRWHQEQYNWTYLHGIWGLQGMLRQGNMTRQWTFSNKCNKKAWFLTGSLSSPCLMHVLVYKHLKRADGSIHRSYRAAVSQMSTLVVASLTCMPNVGA